MSSSPDDTLPPKMVDAHDIAQRTSLLYHQVYATVVASDPSCIERAREVIDNEIRSTGGTMGEQLWARLLGMPWSHIRVRMLADSPEGRLLRSNSPFSIVIGTTDTETRRRMWRQAKRDLSTAT